MTSLNPLNNDENTVSSAEQFWKTLTSATHNCDSVGNMNFINEKALLMMAKMGYKSGAGLGKKEEGPLDSINVPLHLGKRGLGLQISGLESSTEPWDFNSEVINVKEEIQWVSSTSCSWWPQYANDLCYWMIKGPVKLSINDETHYCDPEMLAKILKAKDVFNELDAMELCRARARANPFETIRSAFFMNRAALKMANIDAVTNFIFTDIDRNPHHTKHKGPYYFADVCAGPGGFSEYILWRRKWLFKGFGFTLRGEHDFELEESQCASSVTFGALYGAHNDGDICCPDNILHFAERVVHESEGQGVHFMMSDGGFSVEGNENLQEVLSKQLYICQCLMALCIVRSHGHFVTKLFDLFTPFSVGLIFLMYNCFEKVSIFKPNTSRPANSERYLVCYGLKPCPQVMEIRKYLLEVARELWALRQIQNGILSVDINEIVPMTIMSADKQFYNYMVESNNRIGAGQVVGLLKLAAFCRNPTLAEPRQEELRMESLKHWRIPDKPKVPLPRFTTDDLLMLAVSNPDFMFVPPKQISDVKQLAKLLNDTKSWHYILSGCNQRTNICNFYAGVGGSRVYRLQKFRWVRVKKLQLIRGTLLYGEMVKESEVRKPTGGDCERIVQKQSLHVIDALRLGDTSLADLPFNERLELIETYCAAVNHESQADRLRIRVKTMHPLQKLDSLATPTVILPTLGFDSIREFYTTNSVMLLKVDGDQSFNSMFVTKIQVFFNELHDELDYSNNSRVTLHSFVEFVMSCV